MGGVGQAGVPGASGVEAEGEMTVRTLTDSEPAGSPIKLQREIFILVCQFCTSAPTVPCSNSMKPESASVQNVR